MIGTLIITNYAIESIYFFAFLLACLAAAILGRWTTKRLLLFMAIIAVILVGIKTTLTVINDITPPKTYTVNVSC